MITASWGAFLLAALKALPALITLISALKQSADAATNRGIGYDQAVADSIKSTATQIALGAEVEQQAAADHATKTDDTAFDPDFIRKD